MTEQSYRPRPGSVPWRVLQKFAILPPMSRQTVAELAQLCDVEPKHIKTLLDKCVKAEYLTATFNTEIGNAYKRGPQFSLWRNEAHELPEPEPTPEPEPPEPPPPDSTAPPVLPGSIWSTVPIEDDVPLPRRVAGGSMLGGPNLALDRLVKPGKSFAIPDDSPGVKSLLKLISERHKTTPRRFATSLHKPTNTLRVWRVA